MLTVLELLIDTDIINQNIREPKFIDAPTDFRK